MKKVFNSTEEVEAFVNSLIAEQKYVIDVKNPTDTEGYVVQWLESKNYTSIDGKEYPDEVWMTQDERFFLIQDLEPEHCRNILRMILRQERADSNGMADFARSLVQSLQENTDDEDDDFVNTVPVAQYTLH